MPNELKPVAWQNVPTKPTMAMLNAAIDTDRFKLGDISPLGFRISPQMMFERCWAAMLEAAPNQPTPAADIADTGGLERWLTECEDCANRVFDQADWTRNGSPPIGADIADTPGHSEQLRKSLQSVADELSKRPPELRGPFKMPHYTNPAPDASPVRAPMDSVTMQISSADIADTGYTGRVMAAMSKVDIGEALVRCLAEIDAQPDIADTPSDDLLDQAVAFAEMWGTEENWQQVRDTYVAHILRDRKRERADIADTGGLVERLNYLAGLSCPHDGGFDRERGPIGCDLEADGKGGCFCAGLIPPIRKAATALIEARSRAESAELSLKQAREALKAKDEALRQAERFISNGIEVGFIRMPKENDPAHYTLPVIRAALEGKQS